jgi:hypothetical protein
VSDTTMPGIVVKLEKKQRENAPVYRFKGITKSK